MTTLRHYQSCRSNEGWAAIRIPSATDDSIYTVLISPWGDHRENICECKGYAYRGTCRHQEAASAAHCGWTEGEIRDGESYSVMQAPVERENKKCPRCGGPTKWEVDVVE